MVKKLEIPQITVRTESGTGIALTFDDAKEVYEQLHKLFGEKVTYIALPVPTITPTDPWQVPYRMPVWCTTSTDSYGS